MIGSIAFFATFAIGAFLAWPQFMNSECGEAPRQPEQVVANTPTNDFEAEFSGLPDLEFDHPETNDLIDLIQVSNVYRESEVIASNGETWLTLFVQKGTYSLKYSKARVTRLSTSSYTGEENDVKLNFDGPGRPLLAFRNMKHLSPGKITTAYLRPTSDEISRRNLPIGPMEKGYSRDLSLGDTWYTLRVTKGLKSDGTKVYALVLETANEKQVIRTLSYEQTAIFGDLLWAGDIDRDGKLDLYIDRFNEVGGSWTSLFLSSEADKGKLVKLAVEWGIQGC